ncbi:hypothetical protein PVAND_004840 [Polypedilum vanderplanki]|uniref:Uncharacterized protein n=1 Tax=Polypedilum vanderplanki TaxID=319348 RepID=A0A9J6BYF9_POLVA|nr:hypothetical protein PVAND_004840 [Polypedilum vanderplanki]
MKIFIIVFFILINSSITIRIHFSFEQWEAKFYKNLDASRRTFYRQNFESNLQDINSHNSKEHFSYKKGLNEYSHLPRDQFIKTRCKTTVPNDILSFIDNEVEMSPQIVQEDRNGLTKSDHQSIQFDMAPLSYPFYSFTSNNVPAAVDWSALMQRVQNQASCGACWAFSAMGLIEGILRIRNRTLPDYTFFSPQFLIDCDINESGCEGGWPVTALRFLKSSANGNVAPKTADYPYQSRRRTCNRNIAMTQLNITKVSEKYINGNESALQVQVANYGPTIVSMYSTNNLASYKSGVFSDNNCPTGPDVCSMVNHAVIVVGYGTDLVLGDYWKVKNSWGTTWGENNGYFRIARNSGNMCNIACWAINAW